MMDGEGRALGTSPAGDLPYYSDSEYGQGSNRPATGRIAWNEPRA